MNALADLHWWVWPVPIATCGVIVMAVVFTVIDWRRPTPDDGERTLEECIASHPTNKETTT